MRFQILGDYCLTSGLSVVLDRISETGYYQFFKEKDYGIGLVGIAAVVMCQPSDLGLKQRVKFSKIEKRVYLDVMLDLDQYQKGSEDWKVMHTCQSLQNEIHSVLKKYKIKDFDLELFMHDLRVFLENASNMKDA